MIPTHTSDTARQQAHDPMECRALSDILVRIGDKWTILVVGTLGDGAMRFNEIKRSINGISQRMLTLTLRGLVRDGLATRKQYPTIPPKVEYTLTARGLSLLPPIVALTDWARQHLLEIKASRALFDLEAESNPTTEAP
ncbi:winged helix-turn-helix transcriptional regulator [Sphingobium boeckii]|uniref:DNA-binding HxlR family transcriptional regulator n=1 Tax=Sphingobium boeckii TaxID=1082345 RepID=A0A7W9EEP3_9SPHN|nr:helix-turn-helix domain-containing protein [Sphingobium boeckii]MBB5684876.1 DNA-binding HxlR family transcriptional regulator [Sphingobium boeckii]